MAYTNAQLVRRECGDWGVFARELFSGDGANADFFLKASPILGDTSMYSVKVAGTLKTETTHYTLDKETGALSFTAGNIPAAGTDNIQVLAKAVELSDGDITEALRQRGLVGTNTADTGYVGALLLAAADLADWRWSWWTSAYDISEDGETLGRSAVAQAWRAKAEALRAKARTYAGLSVSTITRLDGYNYNEVDSRVIYSSSSNVRQRYYYVGDLDQYP